MCHEGRRRASYIAPLHARGVAGVAHVISRPLRAVGTCRDRVLPAQGAQLFEVRVKLLKVCAWLLRADGFRWPHAIVCAAVQLPIHLAVQHESNALRA